MQIIFIAFTGIFMLSLGFAVMHWPGASLLEIFSGFSLAIVIFLLGSKKSNTFYERLFFILSAVVIVMGLFKLMYWPNILPEYKGVSALALLMLLGIVVLWTKTDAKLHDMPKIKPALVCLFLVFALVFSIPRSAIYKFHHITSLGDSMRPTEELHEYYHLARFYMAENRKAKALEALQNAKRRMSDVTQSSFVGSSGNLLDTQDFQTKISELELRINALP